ncbi:MAG: ubiquinol-cytochrome c reductase iron-sulfur subunit, partial [Halobacteria archaeon]|nr:ubiquinol-cytochrome c reductase iron-sulfur subunit [Halobacteria archaeon]
GSVAATGFMSVDLLTQKSGKGGGSIKYNGIEIVDGPAPRGMPQIPVEITSGGEIKGMAPKPSDGKEAPSMEIAGFEYKLDWFQYCGVQSYPGVYPSFESNNRFHYNEREWHSDMGGEVMTVGDFSNWESYKGDAADATRGLGKPAWGTWRSQDVDQTMPISIIKTSQDRLLSNAKSDQMKQWIRETCPQGFIAWLNKCTHCCCVPQGFQTSNYDCDSPSGKCAADMVYCQCHQSKYDPFSVVREDMIALPRPEKN